jgi:hypothetical protein
LTEVQLDQEAAKARQARTTAAEYARRYAGNLNEHGKERVVR